jgi:hypothetical protein
MADSQLHSLSLQDILMSMAEALNKAQNELNNMPPYDEYGRPNTIYHLPYLDFNLQVVSEFATSTSSTTTPAVAGGAIPAAASPVRKSATGKAAAIATAVPAAQYQAATPQRALIRFTPVQTAAPVNTATKNTARIESTISGRFVAVVPNEGLPQVFIVAETSTPALSGGSYKFTIKAQIKNVVNEVMANTRVEFNFDAATSASLSSLPIGQAPQFSKNEGLTDTDGRIETTVLVSATDYNNGATFCFIINTSNIQKNISVSK